MSWSEGKPYVDDLGGGLFAYIQPHGGWMVNNCGFMVGPGGGSLLVDTSSTEVRTRAFLASVSERTEGAPKVLVNTHHHPDHTYGNCFVPQETVVVGHEQCRTAVIAAGLGAMNHVTDPDYGDIRLRPPEITFTQDLTLYVDDSPVELSWVGPAHTTNDVLVWAPDRRCVFAGDIVFVGGQPMFLDGSRPGYLAALDAIRALQPEILVPGHGPVCRGEDIPAFLDELSAYAVFIGEVATEAVAEGLSPLEAAVRHRDHAFTHWAESERLVGNLYRACAEERGDAATTPLSVGRAWPDFEAFTGGRIHSEA